MVSFASTFVSTAGLTASVVVSFASRVGSTATVVLASTTGSTTPSTIFEDDAYEAVMSANEIEDAG